MAHVKLLDFYSKTCNPCKMLSVELDKVKQHYGDDVEIEKVDAEENIELASDYAVMGVPAVFLFVDGLAAASFQGYRSAEQIVELIDDNI